MERTWFERRFAEAAASARDFGRKFIAEPLPDAMLFHVHLNSSYDGYAGPEFRLFPEDSCEARARETKGLTADRVVDLLWRDGHVPQWIDLMVVGETGEATVLDVIACGRFTADEAQLYYPGSPVAPFGIKSPPLPPPPHQKGQRFSVYGRSSCYSLRELERVRRNAEKVWFLRLCGPAFDDGVLAAGLDFPALRTLELDDTPANGSGLAGLAGVAQLTYLRVRLGAQERFDLRALPRLRALETLSLMSLPAVLGGVARLAAALPRLRELSLASDLAVCTDTELRAPAVERLTLEFPHLPRWVLMPKALRKLYLHIPAATDDDVCRLLATCRDRLESISLRDSPVSDRVLDALARFPALRSIDAEHTRISTDSLWQFAAQRRDFTCWPSPPDTRATSR